MSCGSLRVLVWTGVLLDIFLGDETYACLVRSAILPGQIGRPISELGRL